METCDDGNLNNNDDCPGSCEPAFCGDGFIHANEECDDANNNPDDGCDNCMGVCGGNASILTQNWNGFTYWKVPVIGTMTDDNIAMACQQCGMQVPCTGLGGCQYNSNFCV